MQKVIEQIYNGEIYPSEQMHVRMEGYEEARQIAVQSHNESEEKLCQPMKQGFDEYLSKESDVTAYHTEQAFVDGFRVGAQMMLEIFEVGKND